MSPRLRICVLPGHRELPADPQVWAPPASLWRQAHFLQGPGPLLGVSQMVSCKKQVLNGTEKPATWATAHPRHAPPPLNLSSAGAGNTSSESKEQSVKAALPEGLAPHRKRFTPLLPTFSLLLLFCHVPAIPRPENCGTLHITFSSLKILNTPLVRHPIKEHL